MNFLEQNFVKNKIRTCLLYTSDAADERSSVDLGGRRIIKKKKKLQVCVLRVSKNKNNKKQDKYDTYAKNSK